MQHRAITLIAPLLVGIAAVAVPAALPAQSAAAARSVATAQLETLSRERVRRWVAMTPTIRCAPAPLTERPTASGEFARPRVVPLEAAFLDATIVKRTFAARVSRARGVN
jgi:hypothetical protein